MQDWLAEMFSKPTTTVPMAGKALGLARNAAYAAAKRGEIKTLRFGPKKVVVPTSWLKDVLGLAA